MSKGAGINRGEPKNWGALGPDPFAVERGSPLQTSPRIFNVPAEVVPLKLDNSA